MLSIVIFDVIPLLFRIISQDLMFLKVVSYIDCEALDIKNVLELFQKGII